MRSIAGECRGCGKFAWLDGSMCEECYYDATKHGGNWKMENTEEQTNIVDVRPDIDNVPVGEDTPQMEAAKVLVERYEVKAIEKDGKKVGDKLVLHTKHPKSDNLVEVSGVMYEGKGRKINTHGMWIKLDKDGKLGYRSAVASMLRFLKIDYIKDLRGKELETVADDNGYLVVKAY